MASSLFRYLGGVQYRGVYAPNILKRINLPTSVTNSATLFHKYVILDGDRPDTIAYHYYGSSLYDWVVQLSNQAMDVYSEWPLRQEELDAVVIKEYGSVDAALQIVSYYKINADHEAINDAAYDALPASLKKYWSRVSNSTPEYYSVRASDITITPASYAALAEGEEIYWEAVSEYDRLFKENESKRAIKLIDAGAVAGIERALKALANDQ